MGGGIDWVNSGRAEGRVGVAQGERFGVDIGERVGVGRDRGR